MVIFIALMDRQPFVIKQNKLIWWHNYYTLNMIDIKPSLWGGFSNKTFA
jgi:hypothetical protein